MLFAVLESRSSFLGSDPTRLSLFWSSSWDSFLLRPVAMSVRVLLLFVLRSSSELCILYALLV